MQVSRAIKGSALLACTSLAATVGASQWSPLPGAEALEVDLASLQQERTLVTAWIRGWGRTALVPEPAAWSASAKQVHRTALRAEFDCSRRTVRVVAAQGYDSRGTPVFMSSVPGPVHAVRDPDLAWAYDALCEAARAGGKF